MAEPADAFGDPAPESDRVPPPSFTMWGQWSRALVKKGFVTPNKMLGSALELEFVMS